MKLETKYLRMSTIFKYPIQSYLKYLTWCEMPWNVLQHIGLLHIRGTKTLSPFFCCFYKTPLWWHGLFSVGGILSGKCLSRSRGTYLSVEWWPWNFLTLSLPCSISSACTSSTLNLKWSIFVCPEFARHITIQFRTVALNNLLNSFMYHLVILFLSRRYGWRSWSFRSTPPILSL